MKAPQIKMAQVQQAPEANTEKALLTFDVAGLRTLIREEVRTALEMITPTDAPKQSKPEYYTRDQVAEMLHVSKTTLTKWRRAGTLKPEKIGGRTLYHAETIEKAMKPQRGVRGKAR